MKRNLYRCTLILWSWLAGGYGLAQGITPRDNEEVKLLARRKVEKSLNDLLNTLTFEDLTESERKEIIVRSYKPDLKGRLFYNPDVIVEDDLQPDRAIDQISDQKVEKYLGNLDLFYAKSPDPTIEFSNFSVSNLKERNYYYVKVFYTQVFKGKNTRSTAAYRPVPRVAELRAERVGKKWAMMVSRLAFPAPGDSAGATLNDVTLVAPPPPTDSASIRARQEEEALALAQREKEVEEERLALKVYEDYLAKGDQAFKAKNYQAALEAYGEAEKRKRDELDDKPRLQMNRVIRERDAARIAEGQLLRDYREKGELARKRRNYAEALGYFHQILERRPDSVSLNALIQELTRKSNLKTEYDEMFSAGQHDKLVDEYTKIIKKDNTNSDWYLGRAKCHIKLNRDDRALEDLNKSIALDYANLDALLTRAEVYRRIGGGKREDQPNLPKAISDYSAYLIIDPKNDAVFAQRAQLRVRTNNLASADQDYTQAIKLNPQQAAYPFERGLLRHQNRQYEVALGDFGKAIELAPEKAEPYFWRGLTYAALNRYREGGAGPDFANALKANLATEYVARIDSVGNSLYAQGLAANEAGQYKPAIAHLTNALAVHINYPEALYQRGRAHLAGKAYNEAIADLTASLGYDPNHGPSYDRRAEAYAASERHEEAAADYKRSSTLNPENHAALLGEAVALMQLRKFQEAILPLTAVKSVQKKIDKTYSPTFFRDVYYRLGQCEYATEQYEKAADDFSTALKFDETYTVGYFDRGAAYEALGRYDRAIDDYQRAIDRNPSAAYYFSKANALQRKGNHAEAIPTFGDVMRTDSSRQWQARTLLGRGTSYSLAGQYDPALADLEQRVVQTDTALCRENCWLATALTHLYVGHSEAALPYLAKCLPNPVYTARAAYATACAHLQKGAEAEALTWFERAFKEKEITSAYVRNDKLLETVNKDFRRKNKPFGELMKKYLN